MVYTLLFFPLQNAVCFIILTYLIPVLFTYDIQGVLKLKKNNSGAKRLSLLLSSSLHNTKFNRIPPSNFADHTDKFVQCTLTV